jgi:hypothetical protein
MVPPLTNPVSSPVNEVGIFFSVSLLTLCALLQASTPNEATCTSSGTPASHQIHANQTAGAMPGGADGGKSIWYTTLHATLTTQRVDTEVEPPSDGSSSAHSTHTRVTLRLGPRPIKQASRPLEIIQPTTHPLQPSPPPLSTDPVCRNWEQHPPKPHRATYDWNTL